MNVSVLLAVVAPVSAWLTVSVDGTGSSSSIPNIFDVLSLDRSSTEKSMQTLEGIIQQAKSMKQLCNQYYTCPRDESCGTKAGDTDAPTTDDTSSPELRKHANCAEILAAGYKKSGVYKIYLNSFAQEERVRVYCDMETDGGGWLVFQRRRDFSNCSQTFTRGWDDYVRGFGSLDGEFWLGNENIHLVSTMEVNYLRVDLEDSHGNKSSTCYSYFEIGDASELYRLGLGLEFCNKEGLGGGLEVSNEMVFATADERGGQNRCASRQKSGWWFPKRCARACNLNRMVFNDKVIKRFTEGSWCRRWLETRGSVKQIEMKLKPKSAALLRELP